MTVLTILAKAPTGEAAKSGPWGLAVILILCAACYFLFKSMSKHMRRVREEFPTDRRKAGAQPTPAPQPPSEAEAAPTDTAPTDTAPTDTAPTDTDQARPDGAAPGA